MREWMLKHPILTFLLLDEIIAAIQTLILKEPYLSTMDETREIAAGMLRTAGQAIREKTEKEEEKEPIGFKAP